MWLDRRTPLVTVSLGVSDGENCTGVLLTRHHILTSTTCTKGDLRLARGKISRSLDTGTISLLSLSSPLPLSPATVTTGPIKPGKESESEIILNSKYVSSMQVSVHLESGEYSCRLDDRLKVSCDELEDQRLNITEVIAPVTDSALSLLGFSNKAKLVPIKNDLEDIGHSIAEDLAKRFIAGQKRILKCRKSENSALNFIMVSLGLTDNITKY